MDQPLTPRDGHTIGKPALNTAGYVYVCFVCVYTALILVGSVLLCLYRRTSEIRMRGLLITVFAIISIHVYVAALFIVYPLNGWFKCGTEFWYMNTVFPLGIAIFQASNVRLMCYSKAQSTLVGSHCWGRRAYPISLQPAKFKKWYSSATYTARTYSFIGIGLTIQILITFILFFGSKRFSPNVGFFGVEVDPIECRRGPEWIPSVVWQFAWTWIVGPYVLFKTRNVKDTHLWAWQTRLAVIAGLPGTPMWLGFLYSKNQTLARVNAWFPPAMWFAPGLMTMQLSCIIFPLIDIYRSRKTRRPSIDSTRSKMTTRSTTTAHSRKSNELASNFRAFEFQLNHNVGPLMQFAATRDFTAENIGFLQDVNDFKYKWNPYATVADPRSGGTFEKELRREMFCEAGLIYFEHICPGTSQAPINVDSKVYYDLEQMFCDLVYEPPASEHGSPTTESCGHGNVVAPWSSPPISPTDDASAPNALIAMTLDSAIVGTSTADTPPTPVSGKGTVKSKLGEASQFYVPHFAPEKFNIDVFKIAEKSIKYLVYTNTWRKYVASADVESLSGSFSNSNIDTTASSIAETELKSIPKAAGRKFKKNTSYRGVLDTHMTPKEKPVDARCASCRTRAQRQREAIARATATKWADKDHWELYSEGD